VDLPVPTLLVREIGPVLSQHVETPILQEEQNAIGAMLLAQGLTDLIQVLPIIVNSQLVREIGPVLSRHVATQILLKERNAIGAMLRALDPTDLIKLLPITANFQLEKEIGLVTSRPVAAQILQGAISVSNAKLLALMAINKVDLLVASKLETMVCKILMLLVYKNVYFLRRYFFLVTSNNSYIVNQIKSRNETKFNLNTEISGNII